MCIRDRTNTIVTKRAGPKTSNMRRKLLIIKRLGFKYPIIFNNPDSNNEINHIKKYLKFPLSNKVFNCASLCIILYKEQNLQWIQIN